MSASTSETTPKKSDLSSIIENLRNQKFHEASVGYRNLTDAQVHSFIHQFVETSSDTRVTLYSDRNVSNDNREISESDLDSGTLVMERGNISYPMGNIVGDLEDIRKTQEDDKLNQAESIGDRYGETTVSTEPIDITPTIQASLRASRKKRMDRTLLASSTTNSEYSINNNNSISNNNNNNNNIKNERLSPGTPDTSSRSRSVTPSSASHPGTPPSSEPPQLPGGRNYSDFMRSLAAKYNNANPNDYFSAARNGFTPPLDPRFKPASFPVIPNISTPSSNKENDLSSRKPDFSSMLSPFVNAPLFPPLIDMSSTQTLLAMVRTAKEAELQGLLKNVKRPEPTSPLDLSAAAPPVKKTKLKHSNSSSPSGGLILPKRAQSESPHVSDDIKNWTVEDVCSFVSSIDICAEYAQNFRDQSIDGSGLPLLTEEHLTTTINMKLGPALKLKSILAKKLGSCNICLHCTHCHKNSASPEPATTTGNSSDSGGANS